MDGLPGVLRRGQLHQEGLHPQQRRVLGRPQEVLDQHPIVELEGECLHGVVDDDDLAEIPAEGAEVLDVVGLVVVVVVAVVPEHAVVDQLVVGVQQVQHPGVEEEWGNGGGEGEERREEIAPIGVDGGGGSENDHLEPAGGHLQEVEEVRPQLGAGVEVGLRA